MLCWDIQIDISKRGEESYKQKEYEKAIEDFNFAINLVPNEKKYQMMKGKALNHLEEYQNAIKCFDKVIGISPFHSAFYSKGKSLLL